MRPNQSLLLGSLLLLAQQQIVSGFANEETDQAQAQAQAQAQRTERNKVKGAVRSRDLWRDDYWVDTLPDVQTDDDPFEIIEVYHQKGESQVMGDDYFAE
jgi:hypothetical protein